MAQDLTTVNQLERIAAELEKKAGIDAKSTDRDQTETSKLHRIADAMPNFVGSIETHTIREHTDTDITSETLNDLLQWNGTDWVVVTPDAAGGTINHDALLGLADDDHLQYILHNGTRALTANWPAGAFTITANEFDVNATIDHRIFDESDNFVIHNPNLDKDFIWRINSGGSSSDFWTLNANVPNLIIGDPSMTGTILDDGIITVEGNYDGPAAWGIMDFKSKATSGGAIGFLIRPEYDGSITGSGISVQPTVAAGQNLTYTGYSFKPPALTGGQNQTYTGLLDESSATRVIISGTPRINNHVGMKWGSTGFINAGLTVTHNETALDLTGGFTNLGAGTATVVGVKLSGYGTFSGTGTSHAIFGNGGTWAQAADNAKITFGAGEDASIYYTGANFRIDPDEQGTAAGEVHIPRDNLGLLFGSALNGDCRIYYDASDMIIDPRVVGSGDLLINQDSVAMGFGAGVGGDAHIEYDGTNFVLSPAIIGSGYVDIQGGLQATGEVNFGGSTSLEIPNDAAPTVNADGEIALDTTVTDFSHGLIRYFGGEGLVLVAMPDAEFVTPADGTVVTYNATNDEFELTTPSGSGDVTAAAIMTDHSIVRGDGGAKGVQDTGILVSDTDILTMPEGANFVFGSVTGTIIGQSSTNKLSLWGSTPIVRPTLATDFTYTFTNDGTDRTMDANATTLNELADVVATIGNDLEDFKDKIKTTGIIA